MLKGEAEYAIVATLTVFSSSFFSLALRNLGVKPPSPLFEPPLATSLATSLIYGGIGFLIMFLAYWIVLRKPSFYVKAFLAAISTPMLVVAFLIVGQAVIVAFLKELPYFLASILILLSICISVALEILLLSESLSPRVKKRNNSFLRLHSWFSSWIVAPPSFNDLPLLNAFIVRCNNSLES